MREIITRACLGHSESTWDSRSRPWLRSAAAYFETPTWLRVACRSRDWHSSRGGLALRYARRRSSRVTLAGCENSDLVDRRRRRQPKLAASLPSRPGRCRHLRCLPESPMLMHAASCTASHGLHVYMVDQSSLSLTRTCKKDHEDNVID
jgi:hypothetical protein